MQISIATRHGELSDASKAKITQKLEKIQRFFERLMSIDVTVDLEKPDEPKVDAVVKSEHKHDFVANHHSNDLFGCIDQIVDKLEQQIKKHKEKLQNRGKNPET